jgi:L-malate glycosyltransferase
MIKPRVCQFSTGFYPGDAITQEMLTFDSYFKKMNWKSEIYSEHIGTAVKNKAIRFSNYKPDNNDIIIYHHSINSSLVDFVVQQKVPKILIYHNVTPSHFFEDYDLQFSYFLRRGKEQLLELNKVFIKAFADSEFNKQELEVFGYKDVEVLPIAYNFDSLSIPGVNRNKFDGIKILFVGRITPNKRQEDLIRFAEIYRKYFRTNFQIQIVGYSSPSSKVYMEELESLVRFWDLEEHVHFSGYVTHPELIGYYRNSNVFLSMSEHEGFCVPILEAMHFQLPVLAYSAGAIPDTMGSSGLLFHEKNYPLIAELIEELLENNIFRNSILKKQNQRIENYLKINSGQKIVEFIQNL